MSSTNTFKKIISKPKVIFVIVILLLSLVSLQFFVYNEGVAIRTVTKDSAASIAGMNSPSKTSPMGREILVSMNNQKIYSPEEYYDFIEDLRVNQTISVKTVTRSSCFIFACLSNIENDYRVTVQPEYKITDLNETEIIEISEPFFNETLNKTVNITTTIEQPKILKELIGVADIGLSVYEAPKNNLKRGLDLQGGTRVLLKTEEKASADEMELILDNIKQRLNVYGLTDIIVREVSGFTSTEQYILVEIAGINSEEIRDLISQQGKFEAKIGSETVFIGGRDITYVSRSGTNVGVDYSSCGQVSSEEYSCRFRFGISLTPEAAEKQAETTKNLPVIAENGNEYLNESLKLFLDDELVDELRIGAELKGNAVTQISISGSGVGSNSKAAVNDAVANMKRLQTILTTGSLPVQLSIVKTDTISPTLGNQFIKNILLVAFLAIVGVSLVIFLRYKNFKVTIPVVITMLSEMFIVLGIASLIGWNLDIAAIAGILIAIGTGVDDQIVIADETLGQSGRNSPLNWKDKIKKAFFIIFAAYATTVVAMIPLYSAGAGLVKGFAVTTILGVTIGVFITRPAFGAILEELVKKD